MNPRCNIYTIDVTSMLNRFYLLLGLLIEVLLDVFVGNSKAESVVITGSIRNANAPPGKIFFGEFH
jgi:hypothetical protein